MTRLKTCLQCNKDFSTTDYILSIGKGKFCSKVCCDKAKVGKPSGMKGKVLSMETINKIKETKLLTTPRGDKSPLWKGGLPNCLDCGKQVSLYTVKRCMPCNGIAKSGDKSYQWIPDRTKLKDDSKERGGQLHREWSNTIKKRDSWKCRIENKDCDGRMEAHHILSWKEHPELRYDINNGITLCHFHHPRKRADEINLSPYFQKMVMEFK